MNPQSDTPETDDLRDEQGSNWQFTDLLRFAKKQTLLCEKLERERNEARREAQLLRDIIQNSKWPKHRFSWENTNAETP